MCMLGKHAVNSLVEFCWLVRDLSFTACCIPNLSYGSISFSMGMKVLAWYATPNDMKNKDILAYASPFGTKKMQNLH